MTDFWTMSIVRTAALAGSLCTGWAAHAEPAQGPDKASRVLPAGVETKIDAAFARIAPTWKLKSAKVDKDRVQATVCAQACSELTLSDPKSACQGKVVGPWCLTWKGAAPPSAVEVEKALAQDSAAQFWKLIPARPAQPAEVPEEARSASETNASGSRGANGRADSSGAEGDNNTLLLVVALLSAAVATFALFRLKDEDEEQAQDAPPADTAADVPADDGATKADATEPSADEGQEPSSAPE